MDKIGVFSGGLWRLRRELAVLSGGRPVRRWFGARGLSAVAGWGHKPSAARARAVAARAGLPYLAVEDGFLRSRRPGEAEPSASYVCDRIGIYYDASGPSALEALARARAADPARAARDAAPVIEALVERGLSKYNLFEDGEGALDALDPDPEAQVLIVDQTLGDAAVTGAGAGAGAFRAMLAAAAAENPHRRLVLKTHPETQIGRRAGYLDDGLLAAAAAESPALARALGEGRVLRLTARVPPMAVLRRVSRVYVVSSLLGLEALAAGRPVACFGQAFYAGWGLTDDRAPPTGRRGPAPLPALLAAAFLDYCAYFTPDGREPCGFAEAAANLSQARG